MGYVVFRYIYSINAYNTVITEVSIKNFKSVQDLTLPLGRFNVLIGSNGSGKSNILEAIAFGAAASADKLDNEFLGSRGIRTASMQLMKSAFNSGNLVKPILLDFRNEDKMMPFTINEDIDNVYKWVVKEKETLAIKFKDLLIGMIAGNLSDEIIANTNILDSTWQQLSSEINVEIQKKGIDKRVLIENIMSLGVPNQSLTNTYRLNKFNEDLANFIIYSPEITSLRKFEEESQIKPLGVKGEGLFNILEIFYENYGEETINEIRKYLHLIEWFDDFEAVFDKTTGRKSLVVKDRNMPGITLNQTNVNEGFLYLLFYISLIISKETPAFFAIDNIEAALHPRLCEELIKQLVELAKKHNKQLILTTHNPFILDGLDLNDPEQKLFVVRRNGDGETIADDIKPIEGVKLSEAWMRGYTGGQPETIE